MATVKRKQNGKVILKDGKVSCSCCGEPECCMYPAQALADGLYTADDLPDEVSYNYNFNGTSSSIVLNKSGSEYLGNIGEAEFKVRIVINNLSIARWEYRIIFPPGGYGPNGVSDCLFFDRFQQPFFAPITDQFADTYTATDPQGNPPITLTRESLCVWRGPEPDLYTLRYLDDSASEGFKCKWAFIDSIKDEGQFQNTPTGNYTQPEQENPWVIS